MNENVTKILKWVGVIALIALPIFLLTKKRASQHETDSEGDSNNIFAEELEEPAS